ncbi:hypothetical protein ACFQV2_14325 [Actinokineospora soli]|uniref:Uncharacterized protein n=1 Tax=Actinokineospora soli TaxID=1048753 RepID=A0ABW2TNZ1_9PSEU
MSIAVTSTAADPVEGEAMPVSPWGTWRFVHPYTRGFRVDPGATATIEFAVDVPADADPGEWWVMVKLMWFGRVQYGPAIPLVVTG